MLGQTQNSRSNRDELLKQLTMLDFMALDLHLYLNTHPTDIDALEMYNDCVAGANVAREKYESEFGPLTAFRSEGCINAEHTGEYDETGSWAWANCQWPWQADFNFSLNEEA